MFGGKPNKAPRDGDDRGNGTGDDEANTSDDGSGRDQKSDSDSEGSSSEAGSGGGSEGHSSDDDEIVKRGDKKSLSQRKLKSHLKALKDDLKGKTPDECMAYIQEHFHSGMKLFPDDGGEHVTNDISDALTERFDELKFVLGITRARIDKHVENHPRDE